MNNFDEFLETYNISIMVSMEADHAVLLLRPDASTFTLPIRKPLGLCFHNDRLLLSSVGKENRIWEYGFRHNAFLLNRVHVLEGWHYIHELTFSEDVPLFNSTGTNSIRTVNSAEAYPIIYLPPGLPEEWLWSEERHPKVLWMNSLAKVGDEWAYSCFSKNPYCKWDAEGYPIFTCMDKKGAVYVGNNVVCEGLTVPHTVRFWDDRLWVCNSGYGEFGYIDDAGAFQATLKVPGWTRGCYWWNNFCFVAYSKLYEPRVRQYAPFFEGKESSCGIVVLDGGTDEVAHVKLHDWLQVFDLIVMEGSVNIEAY